MYQPLPPHPPAPPDPKGDKLTAWDVVYSLNMGIACLITYWIITYILSGFVDQASDFLGGMWAVVTVVFVFRTPMPRPVCGNRSANSNLRQLRVMLAVPFDFPAQASRLRNPAGHRHARDGAIAPARRHRDYGHNHHGCRGGCCDERQRGLAVASAAALRNRRRHRYRGHMQMDRFVSVFLGRGAT